MMRKIYIGKNYVKVQRNEQLVTMISTSQEITNTTEISGICRINNFEENEVSNILIIIIFFSKVKYLIV